MLDFTPVAILLQASSKGLAVKVLLILILPVLGVYIVGLVAGVFLCMATRLVFGFEMGYHRSIQVTAIVATITLVPTLLGIWLNAGLWVTTGSAWAVAFLFGVPIYARMIEDPDTGEIGLGRGLAISSILTVVGICFTLLAVWRATSE